MSAERVILERHALRLEEELRIVRNALDESVKLQSHYAGLLNNWDGGERIQFKSAKEWIARLKLVGIGAKL